MTADDKQVERFFDAVARVIAGKNRVRVAFHYPAPECFDGSCQEVGVFLTGTFTRMCNWGDLLNLVAWFLKYGPEVDDDWKRVAQARRFDPDKALQEFRLQVAKTPQPQGDSMTVHAPRATASALDILSFRFRDTMYPTLRSFFGDDDRFGEFLLQFGGLKFMVPPQAEQERADLCAEALRLLAALNHATATKRHVDAAEADSALDALRQKWGYPNGAPWTSFCRRLAESEAEISEHVRSCKKALGEA